MGKLGGIIFVSVLALTGCAAPTLEAEPVAAVQPAMSAQSDMLAELRPLLKTLKASDSDLAREAFGACANLLFRDKDSYRESVMADYSDMTLALDHLTVAAAAKKHLCP